MIEAINTANDVYYRKYNISSKGVTVDSKILSIAQLPKDSSIENFIFIDDKLNIDTKIPILDSGFETLSVGVVTYNFHPELHMLFDEGMYKGAECDSTIYQVKDSRSILIVHDGIVHINGKRFTPQELLGSLPLTLMFVEFLSALAKLMMTKEDNTKYKERNEVNDIHMFGGEEINHLPCTIGSNELLILLELVKQGRKP